MGTDVGPRGRHWTNIVVILAAGWSVAAASWGAPPGAVEAGSGSIAAEGWLAGAYALAGAGGFLAVLVALRVPWLARGLTAVAGLLVLSGFLALREVTVTAALPLGVTAAAFLASAPFMGPMPTPEEEGKHR